MLSMGSMEVFSVRYNLTIKEFPGSTDEGTLQPPMRLLPLADTGTLGYVVVDHELSCVYSWQLDVEKLLMIASSSR
jgi:hypothetical protein